MTENLLLERVTRLVTPIVEDLRLDLYDVEMRSGTLLVTLDTPAGAPGGVALDTLALASRLISKELDAADPIPGHYTLEVSSPGLERSLRAPRHFRREVGKVVAVRLKDVGNAERRLRGELVAAEDEQVTVRLEEPASAAGEERTIRYEQIDRARTVYDWTPAPKPGKGPGKRAAKQREEHLTDTVTDTVTEAVPETVTETTEVP